MPICDASVCFFLSVWCLRLVPARGVAVAVSSMHVFVAYSRSRLVNEALLDESLQYCSPTISRGVVNIAHATALIRLHVQQAQCACMV